LVEVTKAESGITVKEIDEQKHYLRAEAKSVVPPTGIDDIELFMPYPSDRRIFYRSNSRDLVMAGPQVIGDGGFQKKRLDDLRSRAKLNEMGESTVEDSRYLKDFQNLNFIQKQQLLSQPADVNFLDNKVPDENGSEE
jgi:hypothetical protein